MVYNTYPEAPENQNGPTAGSNLPQSQQSTRRNMNFRFNNGQLPHQQSDRQTYIGLQFSRGRPNTHTKTQRINMTQGSMGATGYTPERNNSEGNFFSPNSFSALQQCENDADSMTATPSCPGKKKATSPLEAEL